MAGDSLSFDRDGAFTTAERAIGTGPFPKGVVPFETAHCSVLNWERYGGLLTCCF